MGVCELSTMPNKRSITAKVIKLRTHCCCGRMSRDMKLSTNFAHIMVIYFFFLQQNRGTKSGTDNNNKLSRYYLYVQTV